MNFKFELGQLVTHKTGSSSFLTGSIKYFILGRAWLESQMGIEELYLLAYEDGNRDVKRIYLYEPELQSLKTEENG